MANKYIQTQVIERLVTRFRLTDQVNQSGLWTLSQDVVPVTNLDELLRTPNIYHPADIAVTATGTLTLMTVPAGKRRTVRAAQLILATGTFTMTSVSVQSPQGDIMAIVTQASAGTLYHTLANGAITLDPGWLYQAYIDAKSVNGTLGVNIYYDEEAAY